MFGRKTETYELKKEGPKWGRKKKSEPPLEEVPLEPIEEEKAQEDTAVWEEPEPEEMEEPAPEPKGKKKKEKRQKSGLPFFKDKRKVGILLVSLSLLMILVVAPLLNYFTTTKMTTAVVAKEDIKQGTPITDEMLATVSVPEAAMLPIFITAKEQALKLYAKTDIAKDEQLSSVKLSESLPFENSYLYTLPTDKKALSVTVSSLAAGLSGKLQADDIVSLYVNISETEDKGYAAKLLGELTYLRVLAVTTAEGLDTQTGGQTEQENALAATITLMVDDLQACTLAGLEQNGKIYAALVSRGDETKAAGLLKTQDDYLAQQKIIAAENAGKTEPERPEEPETPPAVPTEPQSVPPVAPAAPANGGAQ